MIGRVLVALLALQPAASSVRTWCRDDGRFISAPCCPEEHTPLDLAIAPLDCCEVQAAKDARTPAREVEGGAAFTALVRIAQADLIPILDASVGSPGRVDTGPPRASIPVLHSSLLL